MLSRVAENIYWMARYIERAENTARLIMVNTNLLLDLPKGLQPDGSRLSKSSAQRSIFFNTMMISMSVPYSSF